MKRVLFAVAGTVLGLVALLSFKTQGQPLPVPAGGLPSASVSGGATTGAVPSGGAGPPEPTRTGSGTPGRKYVGAAVQTRYGIVQIVVTAAAKRIESVSFRQLTAFDQHSQDINSQAAPILLRETLTAQSAHIDTVSGASYTSAGYVQSLQSALDLAGIR